MDLRGLIAVGYPKEPTFLRCGRMLISLLVGSIIAVALYNLSVVAGAEFIDGSGPGGLAMFTSLWTLAHLSVDLVFGLRRSHAYLRIAFFLANWTTTLFWLAAWTYNASVASSIMKVCPDRKACKKYSDSAAVIAGLGAIIWALMLILSTWYTICCLRDASSVYDVDNSNPVDDVDGVNSTELGEFKAEGPDEQQQQQQQQVPHQAPQQNLSSTPGYHQQSPYQQQHQSYGIGTPGVEQQQQKQNVTLPYVGSDLEQQQQQQQQHVAQAYSESGAVPAAGKGSAPGQNKNPQ